MKCSALILLLFLSHHLFGQHYTISGHIKDAQTGEVLIGANIYVTSLKRGTSTNAYGFYSLTLPQTDSIGILFSYIGYVPQIKKVYLHQDARLDISLTPSAHALEEVVISATQNSDNVQKARTGVVDIPIQKIRELPVILGETDVLKVVQLLPGVQSGNEGTTGFYVRGGNADQNLVQLDEATVYNPNHLFGLFSTFNTRALNNVTLIKGGFPAQYGGRLSSILEIQMKEGNNRQFEVEGGIGLISSQLTVQGPLQKDKASFIVSGRRTYLDLLIRPFLPKGNQSNYNFYDLNAKVNWKLSDRDHLYLSGFKGADHAEYKEAQGINYRIVFGNSTATLRWNHLFSQKLFSNTSLIYNRYKQDIAAILDNSISQVFSGINDITGKTDFQYFPNPSHVVQYGAQFTNHQFVSSGNSEAQSGGKPGPVLNPGKIPPEFFSEAAVYVNDEYTVNDQFSVNLGLRAPAFVSRDTSYYRLEPRATAKFALGPNTSLKASYTLMNQFLHLIPSSTASIPTDIWIPSSRQTKPQVSEQFVLGYFRNFRESKFETSVELYYKNMQHQVLFKEGNQLIQSLDVDSSLVYGKGWSYGAEFFVRKNTGRLTGWVSYTLSRTNQRFRELNFGKPFPFKYDRRHNLSVVGSFRVNDHWSVSSVFAFSSGSVYTLPVGRIVVYHGGTLFEGNYYVYEERNNYRMRPYHRLDISATYARKRKLFHQEYESEWVFSIYNVYSRPNPYFVYLLIDPLTDRPKGRQVSLLPIIPSITYNFKF